MVDKIRLQKFMADAGVCSRRAAEKLIISGQVAINGSIVTQLGTKVTPDSDRVSLNGTAVTLPEEEGIVIALNKPRGYITSTSSRQGRTVYELVPEYHPRLLPVGRLDKDSEGLLLLTNRNELISELTHPRNRHKKRYQVTVSGECSQAAVAALNKAMTIGGQKMSAKVRRIRKGHRPDRHLLEFILTEGKNRQIRRMCESVGLKVHRLFRTEFAGVSVRGLTMGKWRELAAKEVISLKSAT